MRRTGDETRQHIIQCAYELFYSRGFARVGVDQIAETAQLTKRSLYNHFACKDELIAAVLEHYHALAMERIRSWGQAVAGRSTSAAIDVLFTELAGWAGKPRWSGAGFTRLVMELADMPGHPARSIARRHKAAIESWLSNEMAARKVEDPMRAARELMLLLEGTMVMMLISGDRTYVQVAGAAARNLVCPKP